LIEQITIVENAIEVLKIQKSIPTYFSGHFVQFSKDHGFQALCHFVHAEAFRIKIRQLSLDGFIAWL
jgi:hypothetical protein